MTSAGAEVIICPGVVFRRSRTNAFTPILSLELRPGKLFFSRSPQFDNSVRGTHAEGNADGIGIADFVTKTLVDKIDFDALHVNALAAGEPERAKIPMTLKDPRRAIQSAIESVGLIPVNELKLIRIENTQNLGVIEVSSAYHEEIAERTDLEVLSDARAMRFDRDGNLPPFTF